MKQFGIAILIVGFIALCVWGVAHQTSSDHNAIKQWHTSQNNDVIEIEKPWFDSGPWWFHDDDDRIYRATVRDKQGQRRTCWHKFNIFGHAQAWR